MAGQETNLIENSCKAIGEKLMGRNKEEEQVFSRDEATLYEGVSVRPSVGPSVRR